MNDIHSNHNHNHHDVTQAIVAAHAAHCTGHAPQPAPTHEDADPVYQGALTACAQLGFIGDDARCLARAWQRRTERLGRLDAAHWPDAPEDFGLGPFPPAARPGAFAPCPPRLGLYAVLPDATWVARMARAGVPTLQLRFKSQDAEAVRREVAAAVAAVQGTTALLFINDHWQAAIAAGAYGVHLGQEDLDALTTAELQALRASGLRLGVSTHGYAEMLRADRIAPSYIAMGAVFPTTLKQMATAPQGLARLEAYARLLRGYPLVAIGGIDLARLPGVLATGVGSVAVVRALVAEADPEAATRQWLQAMAPVVSTAL